MARMNDGSDATRTPSSGADLALVAMSGGVDSSVAAALLARQGFAVAGVTLRLTDEPGVDEACASAAEAAALLGIDHRVLDGRAWFERRVLRPSWEEYAAGRTPNPCVACNEQVKLALIVEEARRRDARVIATGHYARVERLAGEPARLLRGRDRDKDQSYFLCRLTAEQLALTRLPLGALTKDQVREIAHELALPQAARPESQDACVATSGELAESLRRRFAAEARPGELVDEAGRALGRHEGIHRYTIGQRKGLGVALGCRAYVAAIDPVSRRVTLTTDEAALRRDRLRAVDVRWHAEFPEGRPIPAEVQVRYRHRAVPAEVVRRGADQALVRFCGERRPKAVAPGQAAVFYRGERVLGGGWIRIDDA